MILYSGTDLQDKKYGSLNDLSSLRFINSAQEAIDQHLLAEAGVFLLGDQAPNLIREVQMLYAADKHLSVIILTEPIHYKRIHQSIQLAPFIGKNTLVVALSPEINLGPVCSNAIKRTIQKRSFHRMNLQQGTVAQPSERVKLAQMGTFLEHAPIAALLVSDMDRIENYNQQAKKIFPSLQYLDVDLSKLFSHADTESIRAFLHDGHNPDMRLELTIDRRIMEMNSTEVYDEAGEKFFLLLFNDLTNERQEAQRMQAILQALPQMAWTADAAGNALYFNEAWFFTTGQTKQDALGAGWTAVIYPADHERFLTQWKLCLASGQPFQQAARYKKVDGVYRWHLTRASAIKNNAREIIMWVGTCTDIHDQILLTEELERKVRERTHLLEVSNSELEQFAHVSSHDLQEPLRKIRTFAELLKDTGELTLNDTSKKYLDKISSTAERMSLSLKALLNFTKLHREEKFVPVNLHEIVSSVLIDLELMITQKSAVITLGDLPVINAIPIQMQQLFYNLINNALKFSHRQRIPVISISSGAVSDPELKPELSLYKEYCEIVVMDNGIGFDPKHAAKIFTIFQRLHSKSEYEGTGIGLSLVKKVVSNHKGTIRAHSVPGQGTSFHMVLPVA